MNQRIVFYYVGYIMQALAALLLLPLLVALFYREWDGVMAFSATAVVSFVLGSTQTAFCRSKNSLLYAREGFAIVAFAWIVMSLLGAIPFVLSGAIPSYVDALFETVSGFTTTGASTLSDLESMSRSMLFWRSLTHWIGGMGVLVFIMAIVPNSAERSVHIMRAEMPGPIFGKLVPRVRDTAKILYMIYVVMTVLEIGFLLLGGMPLFDSIVHTFGTAGTGGFGIHADSIGGYSPYIQWVITIFMLLFGVNFNLYYLILIRRPRTALKSTELHCYLGVVVFAVAAVCANIFKLYGTFSEALRHSAFQVASIMTTTGYATTDFNAWPDFSKAVLLVLMFIGGCAGSTAGGLKVSRIVLMGKMIANEIRRMIHPRSVAAVRFEGKQVDDVTMHNLTTFFAVYVLCYVATFLLLSLEPFDFETTFTAVSACINNVGPGFGMVGPTSGFGAFNGFSKLLLALAMLLGRLEIFPILLTFSPRTWSRD